MGSCAEPRMRLRDCSRATPVEALMGLACNRGVGAVDEDENGGGGAASWSWRA